MSEVFWTRPWLSHSDPEPILRDVFDGWTNGYGLFAYISDVTTLPWAEATAVDSTVLDIAYFGNHSGGKFCSPLVKLVLDENGVVPEAARATIAKILVAKYLPNWQHLWATNEAVYNPIHNYDMTESRVMKQADSEAVKSDRSGTDSTEHGMTVDEMDYKFGINTDIESPKPSDKVFTEQGGETSTTSEYTDNRNRVGASEEDEETHRAGNIGVTTTQKLLQEERELWIWNFFDQVFNDIDRELALMFHDSCRV